MWSILGSHLLRGGATWELRTTEQCGAVEEPDQGLRAETWGRKGRKSTCRSQRGCWREGKPSWGGGVSQGQGQGVAQGSTSGWTPLPFS